MVTGLPGQPDCAWLPSENAAAPAAAARNTSRRDALMSKLDVMLSPVVVDQ
jgi:hypothetical protein